jgi:hypothetical protein
VDRGDIVRVELRPDLGDCLVLDVEQDGLHLIATNVTIDEYGVEAWPLKCLKIDGGFLYKAEYGNE